MAKLPNRAEILNALAEGKVSYNLKGDGRIFNPVFAKNLLLKKVDEYEQGKLERVDISMAFDRR